MTPAFVVPLPWQDVLAPVLSTESSHALAHALAKAGGTQIFPPAHQQFHALDLVPPDAIRVVILGQDPYHGAGQAHGLAFSVPDGVRPPPSLRNIFKELARDVAFKPPQSGSLEKWASQGVLLLNTALSVEEARAGSHQGLGWELITDAIIQHAGSSSALPTVFLMWGSHARGKRILIDERRHLCLEAPHPSPLSAHRGFMGCGHFSKASLWLQAKGRGAIDWHL